jgi:hypothetical protein
VPIVPASLVPLSVEQPPVFLFRLVPVGLFLLLAFGGQHLGRIFPVFADFFVCQ